MEKESWYILLSIIGFFGTTGLYINAFFLRGIYERFAGVETSQAIIIANSKEKDRRITELEENQKEIFIGTQLIKERLHSLEGMQAQFLEYIRGNK